MSRSRSVSGGGRLVGKGKEEGEREGRTGLVDSVVVASGIGGCARELPARMRRVMREAEGALC